MHLSFHRNIGNVDRIVRITAGIIFIDLALFNPWGMAGWLNIAIGLFGAAMIVEGVLAY